MQPGRQTVSKQASERERESERESARSEGGRDRQTDRQMFIQHLGYILTARTHAHTHARARARARTQTHARTHTHLLPGTQLATYDHLKMALKESGAMHEGVMLHTLAAMTSAIAAQVCVYVRECACACVYVRVCACACVYVRECACACACALAERRRRRRSSSGLSCARAHECVRLVRDKSSLSSKFAGRVLAT